MGQEINRHSAESGIEQPEKFLAITLEALKQLHDGGLFAINVTEPEFWAWKEQYDRAK